MHQQNRHLNDLIPHSTLPLVQSLRARLLWAGSHLYRGPSARNSVASWDVLPFIAETPRGFTFNGPIDCKSNAVGCSYQSDWTKNAIIKARFSPSDDPSRGQCPHGVGFVCCLSGRNWLQDLAMCTDFIDEFSHAASVAEDCMFIHHWYHVPSISATLVSAYE